MEGYPATPELDRLDEQMALKDFTQLLGEALDLGTVDKYGRLYRLVLLDDDDLDFEERHLPVINLNEALADLFGLDYKKIQDERDAVYQWVSAQANA